MQSLSAERIEILRELLEDHTHESWHSDINKLCDMALSTIKKEDIQMVGREGPEPWY